MSASTPLRSTALVLTLAAASWGIGTVVSKRATAEIPPLTLLPIQLAVSLVALVLFMRWRRLPFRDPVTTRPRSPRTSQSGARACPQPSRTRAHHREPVGPALGTGACPDLFLAGWLLHERITLPLVGLSLVAVTGMLLVIGRPDGSGSLLGVLLTLAGVACCAIYTVSTRRWLGIADFDLAGPRRPAGTRSRSRVPLGGGCLARGWGRSARRGQRRGLVECHPFRRPLLRRRVWALPIRPPAGTRVRRSSVVLPDPGLWCRGRIYTPRRTPQSDAMAWRRHRPLRDLLESSVARALNWISTSQISRCLPGGERSLRTSVSRRRPGTAAPPRRARAGSGHARRTGPDRAPSRR